MNKGIKYQTNSINKKLPTHKKKLHIIPAQVSRHPETGTQIILICNGEDPKVGGAPVYFN